jgi:hypothetical protein
MRCRVAAVTMVSGFAFACGGGTVCLTLPTPMVQAEITDSITAAPAAYRASLIVAGNGFYDSTFAGPRPDSLTLEFISSSPPGKTGDYTVRVRRDGYRLWQGSAHVEGSGCAGALSPVLAVRLQLLQ